MEDLLSIIKPQINSICDFGNNHSTSFAYEYILYMISIGFSSSYSILYEELLFSGLELLKNYRIDLKFIYEASNIKFIDKNDGYVHTETQKVKLNIIGHLECKETYLSHRFYMVTHKHDTTNDRRLSLIKRVKDILLN